MEVTFHPSILSTAVASLLQPRASSSFFGPATNTSFAALLGAYLTIISEKESSVSDEQELSSRTH